MLLGALRGTLRWVKLHWVGEVADEEEDTAAAGAAAGGKRPLRLAAVDPFEAARSRAAAAAGRPRANMIFGSHFCR